MPVRAAGIVLFEDWAQTCEADVRTAAPKPRSDNRLNRTCIRMPSQRLSNRTSPRGWPASGAKYNLRMRHIRLHSYGTRISGRGGLLQRSRPEVQRNSGTPQWFMQSPKLASFAGQRGVRFHANLNTNVISGVLGLLILRGCGASRILRGGTDCGRRELFRRFGSGRNS